jgi:tetratricopeptide (TPR) repeat protein
VISPNLISTKIEAGQIAEPLRALRRGLSHADRFALYIAIVKTPVQRNQLISLLQEAIPMTRLLTVTIRPDTTDILDEILKQLGTKISAPIMVVGFDDVFSTDTKNHPILHSLNLRRPDWPLFIKQPVVFWVPEHLLGIFSRAAPDFLDWRSDTLHFPDLHPADVQVLDSAIWEGGVDSRMPVDARLERIKELESRVNANEHSHDRVILSALVDWLNELGLHFNLLGRLHEARDYFCKASSVIREIGDERMEAIVICNLGSIYRSLCDNQKATECYEQALVIARKLNDRRIEGTALGNIGIMYRLLGSPEKAIEFLEQHLRIAREFNDRRGEAASIAGLALAYMDMGDIPKSNELHNEALKITREIGDRRNEGNVLANLGVNYKKLGDFKRATEFYEQRLTIAREIGDRMGESNVIGNLGNIHASAGNFPKAIEFYERHLKIALEIGDQRGEGAALANLGNAYLQLGDAHKAVELYEQAIVIARKIGDLRLEAYCLGTLALVLGNFNDRTRAITYAEAALKLSEYLQDSQLDMIRAKLAEWRG